MNGMRQTWLVATRELRERSRSRAFLASLVIMVVVVVGMIVAPAILEDGNETTQVGLAGDYPSDLAPAIEAQGEATEVNTDTRRFPTIDEGQDAVRDGDIDVLVVNGRRLEWQRRIDEEVRAVTVGAIQSLAIRQRAATAGIDLGTLRTLTTPVEVTDVELGEVADRSLDDETATFIMTVLLFFTLNTYGMMVLTGVVEEKSSRVVEVLLARMPARNLLGGKITGIGLLGLAQFAVTALAAWISITFVDAFDVPAVRGSVLAWLVVWFVLGYAFYATVFGALGSLASRIEDTQTVAGPVTVLMVFAYFVSFASIGSPSTTWATVVSFFPATAPLVMPARMAMSEPAWWEPVLAAALTVAAVLALVRLGGHIYTNAILHSGPTLKLRDVWRGSAEHLARDRVGGLDHEMSTTGGKTMAMRQTSRAAMTLMALAAAAAAIGTALVFDDVILGIAIGAGLFAVTDRIMRIWSGGGGMSTREQGGHDGNHR